MYNTELNSIRKFIRYILLETLNKHAVHEQKDCEQKEKDRIKRKEKEKTEKMLHNRNQFIIG